MRLSGAQMGRKLSRLYTTRMIKCSDKGSDFHIAAVESPILESAMALGLSLVLLATGCASASSIGDIHIALLGNLPLTFERIYGNQ